MPSSSHHHQGTFLSQDPSWSNLADTSQSQDPSWKSGASKILSFYPPAVKDVTSWPVTEALTICKELIILGQDCHERSPDTLMKLLKPDFMQFYVDHPALKFLIRVYLGLMTKDEWIAYAITSSQAISHFSRHWDKRDPNRPLIIRMSQRMAFHLRHNTELLKIANQSNRVR